MSWYKFVGLDGEVIGMTTFGASAPYKVLFPHFGLTAENALKRLSSRALKTDGRLFNAKEELLGSLKSCGDSRAAP